MPLDRLVVVEIGSESAGRYASRLLAEFGAQVLRVVPPGVTPMSANDPSVEANDLWLDACKEIIEPASTYEARRLIERLVCTADIVIETLPNDELAALGLDLAEVASAPDAPVVVSLTPFGRRSSRSGWRAGELGVQAFGGFLMLSGTPNREPVRAALEQVHHTAGRAGAVAALAGWFGGARTGGHWFDLSLAEVAITLPPFHIQQYTHAGLVSGRGPAIEPPLDGEHVPTKDGAITFATGNTPTEMFAALFEADELVDERFQTPAGRTEHRDHLARAVHEAVAGRTSRDLFERALELNIVAGVVQSPDEILNCPHLAAQDAWRIMRLGDGRQIRLPAGGISASGLGRRELVPPVPAADLVIKSQRVRRPIASIDNALPLVDLTIVSFEDVIALPWSTVQLARLGARVIRVESLTRLQSRHWGVFPQNDPGLEFWNEGGNHCSLFRSKESVVLDLQHPLGRDAALRLVAAADVVLSNFRPGVMDRLGIGIDAIRSVNPRAVLAQASGYGATGPYAGMGAFARTIDAMSGLTHLTGYRGGSSLRANPSYMDAVSAWNIAFATLLGLIARQRWGVAFDIDLSMYGAGVATIAPELVHRQIGEPPRKRSGNEHPHATPQNLYATGDGRWVSLEVDDASWPRLVGVTALAAINRPIYMTMAGRRSHQKEIDAVLAGWCVERNAEEIERMLQSRGVAAVMVRDARDLVRDPSLHDRGCFEWIRTPTKRLKYERPYAGTPLRDARTARITDVQRAPAFGEHTEPVLTSLAGLTIEECQELRRAGVTDTKPRPGVVSRPVPIEIERGIAHGALVAADLEYESVIERLRNAVVESAS